MANAQTWKRRERALAAGVIVWAVSVSAFLTLRPEYAAEVILDDPLRVAGYILITIGFAGGFCESVILAIDRYATPNEREELTEVPWNDE